jgi:hypothetical protein
VKSRFWFRIKKGLAPQRCLLLREWNLYTACFISSVQNKQMKVGYLNKKFLHFDTSGKFFKIVIHLVPCVVICGMVPARKHLLSNYSLQIFFGSLHVFLYMSNDS